MKTPPSIRAAACVACALLFAGHAGAQEQLQEFEFDTGLSGWTAEGDAATQVTWDGTTGSPSAGSLLLGVPADVANGLEHKAVGECRVTSSNSVHTVTYRVLPGLEARAGRCFAVPVYYSEPGCEGEGSVTGTGNVLPEGQWTPQMRSATSFGDSRSMRIEFVMALDGGAGAATCHLDSVSLFRGVPPAKVPSLTPAPVALMLLLLAVLARRRLSRSGGRPRS